MGTFIFNQQNVRQKPNEPGSVQQQPALAEPQTVSEAPEKENKDGPVEGSVRFPELRLFQVQVGAFGQKANAERLAQQFSVQGLPVELVSVGNLTQVRTGMFFGRPTAEATKSRVSTDGLEALVVEKAIAGKEVSYSGSEKDYYQFIMELADCLAQVLTAAEEGRLEWATAEIAELTKAANNISIPKEKKEIVSTLLHDISSSLIEATKASDYRRTNAVSQGVGTFINWYQGLPGAD